MLALTKILSFSKALYPAQTLGEDFKTTFIAITCRLLRDANIEWVKIQGCFCNLSYIFIYYQIHFFTQSYRQVINLRISLKSSLVMMEFSRKSSMKYPIYNYKIYRNSILKTKSYINILYLAEK